MNTKPVVLALAFAFAFASPAAADHRPVAPPASRAAATLAQIETTFGFVPSFVKAVPATLLPAWWDSSMSFEDNPNTKLGTKTKQLIALAVSAQVPCEYCVYYHTEAARLAGATDEELREAVAMAGSVRQNSTIMNGMQVDRVQFRKDIERISRAAKQGAARK